MSGRRSQKREWQVRRMFEPDRLSVERLIDAYERLVSSQMRVIKRPKTTPKCQTEATYHNQKGA